MENKLALPKAVQEQAERAEAAYAEMMAGRNTDQSAPPPTPDVPQVESQAVRDTPEAPVVTPVVEETPQVQSGADQWELKYKVLQGKFQAEVPRLAAELRELKDKLATQTTQSAPTDSVSDTSTGLTPQQVTEQYGEDFAAAVSTIADAQSKKLRDELSSKVEEFEADVAKRTRSDFMRDLQSLSPQWAATDVDPGFTSYLDEFDAHTGRTRREFFNEATRQNDAPRVASFFSSYTLGKQPVRSQAHPPVAPSLEHLISPDSSRHSEAPPGKKLWSKAEVAQFYADSKPQGGNKSYGRFSASEYERIDNDITLSPREGRYIG